MAFKKFDDAPRKMFQGNWKCGKCGKDINELPFEPDPSRFAQLTCRDCHSSGAKRDFSPKKMIEGNWTCNSCGGDIKSLPFEPREGTPVSCRDCWSKNRG